MWFGACMREAAAAAWQRNLCKFDSLQSRELMVWTAPCALCSSGGRPTCIASPRWSSSCAWQAAGHRCALEALSEVASVAVGMLHCACAALQPATNYPHRSQPPLLQAASKQLREVLAEAAGRGAAQR